MSFCALRVDAKLAAKAFAGIHVQQTKMNGDMVKNVDFNRDQKTDLKIFETSDGFNAEWYEHGNLMRQTHHFSPKYNYHKLEQLIDGNQWLLIEQASIRQLKEELFLHQYKRRLAANQYEQGQYLQRGKALLQTTPPADDRSYPTWAADGVASFVGYETASARAQRIKTETFWSTAWDSEYSQYTKRECRMDMITPFATDAGWSATMRQIITSGNWDDLAAHITVNQCGQEFVDNTLPDALFLGLSCLQDLGGQAAALAAQVTGVITESRRISNPAGRPFTIDCSVSARRAHLYSDEANATVPATEVPPPITATASGVSLSQCTEGFPTLVMQPGTRGIHDSMGRQTATLFHEMLHTAGLSHSGMQVDRTYWCAFACFADDAYAPINPNAAAATSFSNLKIKARDYCNGNDTTMDKDYWIDYLAMMSLSGQATSVAYSALLENPTALSDNTLFSYLVNNLSGQGVIYTMAFFDGRHDLRQRVVGPVISESLMTDLEAKALRMVGIIDTTSNHTQYDYAAQTMETLARNLNTRMSRETDPDRIGLMRQMIDGLNTMWGGFCWRHRAQITRQEFCLDSVDLPAP